MFSTLRTRFGIPGVISVIALVFAMFGGAYAASNSSDAGKATASAKAKKGPRGPKGPKGDTGPAGPQGPAGPAGPAGPKGDAGAPGSNGAPGADGKSVTGEPIAAPGACGENATGVKYTLNSVSTNVCNGTTGFTATLPKGSTETGTWWIQGRNEAVEISPVSFPIPLSAPDAAAITIKFWQESQPGSQSAACTGTPNAPEAEAGTICFYVPKENEAGLTIGLPLVTRPDGSSQEGVGTTGAFLRTEGVQHENYIGGTFAVTAPEAP